jgi:hypothetical protein
MSKLAEQQEINNQLDHLQKMVDSAFIKLEALELENIKLKAENAQLVEIIRDMAMKEFLNA